MDVHSGEKAPCTHDVESASESLQQCLEVLSMWVAWHDRQAAVTAELFKHRNNTSYLERLLDDLEQARNHAAELSRELLESQARAATAPPV